MLINEPSTSLTQQAFLLLLVQNHLLSKPTNALEVKIGYFRSGVIGDQRSPMIPFEVLSLLRCLARRMVPTMLHLLNITLARSSKLTMNVHVDASISTFGTYNAPNTAALREQTRHSTLRRLQLEATVLYMCSLLYAGQGLCARSHLYACLAMLHGSDQLCPAPA